MANVILSVVKQRGGTYRFGVRPQFMDNPQFSIENTLVKILAYNTLPEQNLIGRNCLYRYHSINSREINLWLHDKRHNLELIPLFEAELTQVGNTDVYRIIRQCPYSKYTHRSLYYDEEGVSYHFTRREFFEVIFHL